MYLSKFDVAIDVWLVGMGGGGGRCMGARFGLVMKLRIYISS